MLRYGNIEALRGISFHVGSAEKIAFVGESGSGKSSIVNLLLRLYDVTQGAVLLNGENIKNYTLQTLRSNISVVSQRVYMFADTIAANVAYGQEYDEERIVQALKLAGAYDFVECFPLGIATPLEEFATNLSGGQKQRIALARAIYKDASVFVLDEATSALDNESERQILQTIQEVTKDKIVIAIAHRLSTIEQFERIYVLEEGKIVESGDHKSLLSQNGKYRQLYEKALKE